MGCSTDWYTHYRIALVFAVVDDHIGAELLRVVLRRASGRDDVQACTLRQLNGECTNRGRSAVDDDSLASVRS